MTQREDIMTALFALFQSAADFKTAGRRVIMWNKVAEQPALFLRNTGDEYPSRPTGLPAKLLIKAEAWIYANSGKNPDVAPAIELNNLIDAIAATLKPKPGREAQTLGGLVHHCWIEGVVDIHPGDLDGQAIAVVPIRILAPAVI